jgi:GNAT superfamily N-acetyltransferase
MAPVVTTTWLEMTDPAALRPGRDVRGAQAVRVRDPEVNRAMYAAVGGPHQWTERLGWSDARWARLAARVETWVAQLDGRPAGFAELDVRTRGEVKILYFGLLPRYQGIGLGGWFLTEVLRRAWAAHPDGTRRVWLHTCSLDGPHALANYEARGLTPYRRESMPSAA